MLYHPCIQLVDDVTPIIKSDNIGQYGSRKLRFCPPTNAFELCHYKMKLVENDIPVKAYFQMKVCFYLSFSKEESEKKSNY